MSTTTTSRPASGRAERAPGRTSGAGALARSLRTHPELWALGAIVAGGIALRFSTLGLQSFWADEAVTVGRVLRPSPWSTLGQVHSSEATPPLYYILAWLWTRVFGHSEVGIRSLSAVFGTATIPVVWWAGRTLVSRAAGIAAAALVAASPAMVWYSQEARAYVLLILLSAVGFGFFAVAVRRREGRVVTWWAVASVLALLTHYFAIFRIVPEALALFVLLPELRRRVVASSAAILAVCGALVPLAVHQANQGHDVWISNISFGTRLDYLVKQFVFGYHGSSSSVLTVVVLAPLLATAVLATRGSWRSPGWRLAAAIGVLTIGVPIAAKVFGQDFFFPRNVIASWIPLAVAGGGAVAVPRLGWVAVAALCAAFVTMAIAIDVTPKLQRSDWRDAAKALGPGVRPRAVLGADTGANPLTYYLRGAHKVSRGRVTVSEVDTLAFTAAPVRHARVIPRGFRFAGRGSSPGFIFERYVSDRPRTLSVGALSEVRLEPAHSPTILQEPR